MKEVIIADYEKALADCGLTIKEELKKEWSAYFSVEDMKGHIRNCSMAELHYRLKDEPRVTVQKMLQREIKKREKELE